MKVALLDLTRFDPGGGDVTWLRLVRDALERRGDTVTHIRTNLYKRDPNVVRVNPRNPNGFAGLLASHDVVLIPDPIGHDLDKDARRAGQEPFYLTALPGNVMTHLHGPISAYPDYGFTESILHRATRLSYTRRAMLEGRFFKARMTELPYLPFARTAHKPTTGKAVVMTGRLTGVKGQAVLARLAPRLHADVVLGGSSMVWASQALQESLMGLWGVSKPVVRQNRPWAIQTPTGNTVYYRGEYPTPDVLLREGHVHVNLTSWRWAPGHLEYTTLEALDLGLICVVPHHAVKGLAYRLGDSLRSVTYYTPKLHNADELVAVVNAALDAPPPNDTAENFALHDADRYVEQLVKEG